MYHLYTVVYLFHKQLVYIACIFLDKNDKNTTFKSYIPSGKKWMSKAYPSSSFSKTPCPEDSSQEDTHVPSFF